MEIHNFENQMNEQSKHRNVKVTSKGLIPLLARSLLMHFFFFFDIIVYPALDQDFVSILGIKITVETEKESSQI